MGRREENLGKIISLTRKIEARLEKMGASGNGIHSKVSSIEKKLDKELIKKLRWIATIRNNAMHAHKFKIDDFYDFKESCKEVIRELKSKKKR